MHLNDQPQLRQMYTKQKEKKGGGAWGAKRDEGKGLRLLLDILDCKLI